LLKDLIGIPFADRGRDRGGMDCWGLAMAAMRHFGKDVPDFDVSCFDTPSINGIYERERGTWMTVCDPEPGDVVAMRIDAAHPDMVQHIGVYIGSGRFIHTLKKRDSHIVRMDDPYWSRKVVGCYRWVG